MYNVKNVHLKNDFVSFIVNHPVVVLLHLSKGQLSEETIVEGTLVHFVQVGIGPRRLLFNGKFIKLMAVCINLFLILHNIQ